MSEWYPQVSSIIDHRSPAPRSRLVRARRKRWAYALFALATASGCVDPVSRPDFSGENLLIITIDTLRADRLGAYGYAAGATPHFDRLADAGVRFESCYSSVPLTLPSHATLFTGRYPFATGVRLNGVNYLEDSAITLAELFQARGFSTSATVSSYVLTSKFGLDQGFDRYEDSLKMGDIFRFYNEIGAAEVYKRFSEWRSDNGSRQFFGWVHFYDVHAPYDPPSPFAERFPQSPYNGEISYVDEYLGKIIEDLRGAEILDRTLVVVTSDHGEAFGEHVEEGHGLLCYEEAMRVPLVFYAPGRLPSGRVVKDRVGLIDLFATLVELFGLEVKESAHGRSLVSLLVGDDDVENRRIYFESMAGTKEKNWAPRTGLIQNDMKYIRVPEPELYDLSADPGETRNLFDSRSRVSRELDAQLRDLLLTDSGANTHTTRELSAEDRQRLEALGYLSSSSAGTARTVGVGQVLDPKLGIVVEMQIRTVQTELEKGDVGAAERALDKLTSEHGNLDVSDFYALRHQIFAARGDKHAAVKALVDGLARFPESALAFKLATYHFEIGDLQAAQAGALALLERFPKFSQAINLQGMIAEKQADLPRALAFYEEALTFEPHSVPLLARIADVKAKLGQAKEALEIYERLVAAGALDGEAEKLYKAATLNTMVGNLPRAEELFQRGLEVEPGGRHYLSLAMVQFQLGKANLGMRSLETALARHRADLATQEIQIAEATLRAWASQR